MRAHYLKTAITQSFFQLSHLSSGGRSLLLDRSTTYWGFQLSHQDQPSFCTGDTLALFRCWLNFLAAQQRATSWDIRKQHFCEVNCSHVSQGVTGATVFLAECVESRKRRWRRQFPMWYSWVLPGIFKIPTCAYPLLINVRVMSPTSWFSFQRNSLMAKTSLQNIKKQKGRLN